MTKSPRSAIRLRLSKLIQVLLALCVLKLGLLGAAILDLPLPGITSDKANKQKEIIASGPTESEVAARLNAAMTAAGLENNADTRLENTVQTPAQAQATLDNPAGVSGTGASGKDVAKISEPQGQAAAELASAARPAISSRQSSPLPRPLLVAGPLSAMRQREPGFSPDNLAIPQALSHNRQNQSSASQSQTNFLDMLGLRSLPIPGLGSARIAQAAALDMPVPPTRPSTSPFAPAEQSAGEQGQAGPSTVLPQASPIPAQIPRGQNADGSPLAPRTGTASPAGLLPQLPNGSNQAMPLAPVPQIKAAPNPVDPNAKAQELARQQQDMLMLRQQMDQRLKDLQNAEEKMKSMIREAKDLEDKKIRGLIQMYANMKPRTAAQAMENMDERVAVRILSGMAPKQSGEILTYTNPAKTAKFTELITRMRLPE